MSTVKTIHGQYSVVDEQGNVSILHPETSASDVGVDTANTKVPSQVKTAQDLANKMGTLAFKDSVEYEDISGMVANDLTISTAGKVLDARSGKVLNDRLTTIEDSEILVVGLEEENTGVTLPESEINDNITSNSLTWSSSKINDKFTQISNDVAELVYYIPLIEGANQQYTTEKTVQEIEEAYQAGKALWIVASDIFIPLRKRVNANTWIFSGYTDTQAYDVTITSSGITVVYNELATTNDTLPNPNALKLMTTSGDTIVYDGSTEAEVSSLATEQFVEDTVETEVINALNNAKTNGEFDGVSASHSWNGTTLTVTSASGTSSADLKGEKGDSGVYVGSGDMPEGYNVQIDLDGDVLITPNVLQTTGDSTEDTMSQKAITEAIKEMASIIPESNNGTAIIDVLELPTENINKGVFYRLLRGALVINQHPQETYTIHCVESLPEVGLPATNVNQTQGNIYYVTSDDEAYGYIDDMLSMGMGVPVGWYDDATLLGALGYEAKGTITDIVDDPCDDGFRILLTQELYMYQDCWCRVAMGYEKPSKFDVQWDGDMSGKTALDMSMFGYDEGTYFVKVSDSVPSINDVVDGSYTLYNINDNASYTYEIYENYIDTSAVPGAFVIDNLILVVHSEDELATAMELPAGYIPNGVYYLLVADTCYIVRLTTAPRVTKIDSKYLDLSEVNVDLSDYATRSEIQNMISDAIGSAIGGSY